MSTYGRSTATDPYPGPTAAGTEAPALELRHVHKRYAGGVDALVGIDVRVCAGEQVAVVGPSGSGKSTMLHVMGTLERPSDGEVRIAGRDISKLTDREVASLRARTIGFVFQQFFLLDSLNALENVGLGLLYQDVGARERQTHAALALERVGLAGRMSHRPSELSGGEAYEFRASHRATSSDATCPSRIVIWRGRRRAICRSWVITISVTASRPSCWSRSRICAPV